MLDSMSCLDQMGDWKSCLPAQAWPFYFLTTILDIAQEFPRGF